MWDASDDLISMMTGAAHRKTMTVRYGIHRSPFGLCLLALAPQGICALRFVQGAGRTIAVAALRARWPTARLEHRPGATKRLLRRVFGRGQRRRLIPVRLHGTPFQLDVWNALAAIPFGETRSYAEIARAVGKPKAFRAVGLANGANPLPIVIPCHRVIASGGKLGGYGGGLDAKRRLLALEKSSLGGLTAG